MTTPLRFEKPALMKWGPNPISDHNRSPLSVNVQRIETTHRMANGTLRKYIVADKRKFSVSWDDLPHSAQYTVDGFWGAREIENFYNTVPGPFVLSLTYGDGTVSNYTVMITDFSSDVNKRGFYDFVDVSVEMEEV